MKRIIATLSLAAAFAWAAGAQDWTDALNWSQNDYLGTARSVALGNAMTAVGGDLGSLTLNPAGSAVAGYSQITITPGLSVSSVFGQGTLVGDTPFGFEDPMKTTMTRGKLPNIGAVLVLDTRNRRGLKRVSFGIVSNVTKDFSNYLRASGTNTSTSLAGSLATQADGWPTSVLDGSFFDKNIPSWETMVGYQGGLFDLISGTEASYIGLTERRLASGDIQLADRIGQYYGLRRTGSKQDLLLNLGLDFSDRFYVGANVGITTMKYTHNETRSEEAVAGASYPSDFQSLRMRSVYDDTASGIYAKLGFIARPTNSLRIGAAVQTPTMLDIREEYQLEGQSVAENVEMSRSTPNDEVWFYRLRMPWRANAGVAYTFGQVAMFSVDYEYCDYSTMRFRPAANGDDYADFSYQNADIQDFTRSSHAFRAGVEIKPVPSMAIRVGYNLATSPEVNVKSLKQNVSFGLGYDSPGSFFADFAVRFQYLPKEYITPYYYYFYDQNDNMYIDDDIATPEICGQSSLFNALLTLGWRF